MPDADALSIPRTQGPVPAASGQGVTPSRHSRPSTLAEPPVRPRPTLADRLVSRWVLAGGERVNPERMPWLGGPEGQPAGSGQSFLDEFARRSGLIVHRNKARGILPGFRHLAGPGFDSYLAQPNVIDVFDHTAGYQLEARPEWVGVARLIGSAVAGLFGHRLREPGGSHGPAASRLATSEIVQFIDARTGDLRHNALVRELPGGRKVYEGSYPLCRAPALGAPCLRVVLSRSTGGAILILKPIVGSDGSLTLSSAGEESGAPGVYLTARDGQGALYVRYLGSLRVTLRLASDGTGVRGQLVITFRDSLILRVLCRLRPGLRHSAPVRP